MIEIEAPDGTIVEFPDGTSRDTMRAAMQKRWGSTQSPTAPPAPEPNIYERAAAEDLDKINAAGISNDDGYGRRIVQGATLGFADEIYAGLQTPLEMLKRGVGPSEGYEYAKARENETLRRSRDKTGVIGTVAEIAGGAGTGLGLARGGVTFAREGAGLAGRVGRTAADAATFGAVVGAGEGEGTGRLTGAATGAAIGGALGGALPVAGLVASPVVSAVRARVSPDGVAAAQFVRAMQEAGRTPQEIAQALRQAAQEGQGSYTVADELGNAGQRLLSGVARSPGPGRQNVVEFLDARQAGQGRRLTTALEEGFEAGQTARQLTASREAARRSEADQLYGAARAGADNPDLSGAIQMADDRLRPGVTRITGETGIADNSIDSAVRRARSFLTDGQSVVNNFDDALLAKQELDNIIESGTRQQQAAVIPMRDAVERALEQASPDYAAARNAYREASRGIEAIDIGRTAATRGRSADTIPAFQRLAPNEQAGFRSGYGDRLIEGVEGSAEGVNKARQFTSDAYQAEIPAFAAPGRADVLTRQIDRENRMFQTRNHALGGSRTADNLADMDALSVDPSIVANILTGNVSGAVGNLARAGSNLLTGNTPEVRERVANILLQRYGAGNVDELIQRVAAIDEQAGRRLQLILSGTFSGTSTGAHATLPNQRASSQR